MLALSVKYVKLLLDNCNCEGTEQLRIIVSQPY